MPGSGHYPDGDADAQISDPLIGTTAWRKDRRTVSRTKERSEQMRAATAPVITPGFQVQEHITWAIPVRVTAVA